MTELQQAIERLLGLMAKATPGPWFSNRYRGSIDSQVWAGKPGPDTATLICSGGDAGDADADLIAAMRNALPLLLSALSQPDGERERLVREVRNEALRQMDDLSHDMDAAIPKMLFRAADLLALQMIATSALTPGDIREAAALELAKHFGENSWGTMANDRAALRGLARTSPANYDINEPTREDCYDAADAVLALRTQGEGV